MQLPKSKAAARQEKKMLLYQQQIICKLVYRPWVTPVKVKSNKKKKRTKTTSSFMLSSLSSNSFQSTLLCSVCVMSALFLFCASFIFPFFHSLVIRRCCCCCHCLVSDVYSLAVHRRRNCATMNRVYTHTHLCCRCYCWMVMLLSSYHSVCVCVKHFVSTTLCVHAG